MTPDDPILEVRDLTLELGDKRVLDRLSLRFRTATIDAVVGPNGAGKTTVAAVIMGLSGYQNYRGDVLFQGKSLRELSIYERARRGITLGWQEPARYEGLDVRTFIQAGVRDGSTERARQVLEQVGLDPDNYLDRPVDRTLSGGERKRIELASILAMEPRLVIMDEPDSGIDVEALNRIFDALHHLKQRGVTVVLITHSLTVLRQADNAFLICCGQLVDQGEVEKITSYFGERCIPCDHKNRPSLGEPLGGVG
jgi:Fe-S cluster assembly ATP-binding protein